MEAPAQAMATAPTVAASLSDAVLRLRAAGVPDPRRDASLLLGRALGSGPEALVADPGRRLDVKARGDFARMVARRAAREPVSRILGKREFWSLEIGLDAHVLDPRPDSEIVVETVLARLDERNASLAVLDLGSGSGCLLLALLSELPGAHGVALDICEGALRRARENARALGLDGRMRLVLGDWATALGARFDVVVTNPPYVSEPDLGQLAPEIAGHDPRVALAGGADGIDAYRTIAPALARLLTADGFAALEIGHGQAARVRAVVEEQGLEVTEIRRDLAGVPRCLLVRAVPKRFVKEKKGLESTNERTRV